MKFPNFDEYLNTSENLDTSVLEYNLWKSINEDSSSINEPTGIDKKQALAKSDKIIQLCKLKIIKNFQWFKPYLDIMPPIPKFGVGTMSTSGSAIYYDPIFVIRIYEQGKKDFKLDKSIEKAGAIKANSKGYEWYSDYVCFIIIHEIMHNSLKHFKRSATKVLSDHLSDREIFKLWNLAQDYEINRIIKEQKDVKLPLLPGIVDYQEGPFKVPEEEMDFYAGSSSERIFWRLLRNLENKRKKQKEDEEDSSTPPPPSAPPQSGEGEGEGGEGTTSPPPPTGDEKQQEGESQPGDGKAEGEDDIESDAGGGGGGGGEGGEEAEETETGEDGEDAGEEETEGTETGEEGEEEAEDKPDGKSTNDDEIVDKLDDKYVDDIDSQLKENEWNIGQTGPPGGVGKDGEGALGKQIPSEDGEGALGKQIPSEDESREWDMGEIDRAIDEANRQVQRAEAKQREEKTKSKKDRGGGGGGTFRDRIIIEGIAKINWGAIFKTRLTEFSKERAKRIPYHRKFVGNKMLRPRITSKSYAKDILPETNIIIDTSSSLQYRELAVILKEIRNAINYAKIKKVNLILWHDRAYYYKSYDKVNSKTMTKMIEDINSKWQGGGNDVRNVYKLMKKKGWVKKFTIFLTDGWIRDHREGEVRDLAQSVLDINNTIFGIIYPHKTISIEDFKEIADRFPGEKVPIFLDTDRFN